MGNAIIRLGRRVPHAAGIVAIGLVASACSDVSVPTETDARQTMSPRSASFDAGRNRFVTPDDEEARISREEIPGYAGSLFEEDGTRTILMADTNDLSARLERLRERFAKDAQHPIGRVRKVHYDFDQLKRVRDVIFTNGLGTTRWSTFDVDERANRVVVGVADATQIGGARAALRELGVSDAMVEVKVVPPFVPGPLRASSCLPDMSNCGTDPELDFGHFSRRKALRSRLMT